jgi:TonB family protein
MRLIWLVLALVVAPLAGHAEQAEQRQSKDFPGGVVFVERIDGMTDKRACSVHTPMRGIEAVLSGGEVAFFVHERLGPVVRNPRPSLRLRQGKPIPLATTDRPYLVAVPQDRARETIEALYTHSRIIVRWYDLRQDEHTMTIETGDFGAAYDHAVIACGWPRLTVKRGTFVAEAAPTQLAPRSTDLGAGAIPLSDFPYAYYVREVSEKIRAQWTGRAVPGRQPAVIFEIRRDGRLNQVEIDKSSGNALYDQVAIRAINAAGPFSPLPEDFKESVARLKLQFTFDPSGG